MRGPNSATYKLGVRYFPKGIFPRATSPVATSQMCNLLNGNFAMIRKDLLRRRRLQWGSSGVARMC